MYRYIIAVMTTTACLWSMQVSAETVDLTEWGATARTDSASCSGCSIFDLSLEQGEVAGGSQQTSATIGSALAGSAVGLQGRGTAGASVEIPVSGLNLPVLRARAESTASDGWVGGTALGIQAYQFTGADNTAVTLDVSLTGTVNNPGGSSVTGLEVNVWILRETAPFSFPPNPVPVADLVAQIFLDSLLIGIDPFLTTPLGWDAVSTGTGVINRSTTSTDPGDQLSFTLNNGDEFYLFAGLSAMADGTGASALSWSTLTMDFDSNDLLPASAVPLPAAFWLFGSALAGLGFFGGRRSRNPQV